MTSRNQRKKQNARKRSEHVRNAGAHAGGTTDGADHVVDGHHARSSDETKPAVRTTELIAYAATVLAVIMTALAQDADGEGGRDPFGAETAVRYITYLTIGYLVARGLAKSGSWRTRRVRRVDGGHDRAVAADDHDHVDHDHDHVERHDHDGDAHHGTDVDEVDRDDVPDTASPTHEDEHVVRIGGAGQRS